VLPCRCSDGLGFRFVFKKPSESKTKFDLFIVGSSVLLLRFLFILRRLLCQEMDFDIDGFSLLFSYHFLDRVDK